MGTPVPARQASVSQHAPGLDSPRVMSARKAWNYCRVVPGSFTDAYHLYAAYLRTAVRTFLEPSSFGTVGERLYSSRPIRVRFGGLSAFVRPRSEDLAIFTTNHEPGVIDWFLPRQGELVVDVGAHIGTYTLRAAKAGADVVAFEPNPDSYRLLCENVKLNGFRHVSCRNVALGSETGVAQLIVPDVYLGRAWTSVGAQDSKGISVRLTRLDDEIPESPARPIDWLKVDVEGFELEVLKGATGLLHRTKRIIIEITHGNESLAEELLLRRLGFVRLREFRQPSVDYWLLAGSAAERN